MLTLPPEKGIVTDKRGHLARADGETDGSVDEIREERDSVLKVVMCNLHDACRVLDNSRLGRQKHLRSSIEKAVDGLDASASVPG